MYTNWAPGQPDNLSGGQNCALTNFDLDDKLGRWDDDVCSVQYPYSCEIGIKNHFLQCLMKFMNESSETFWGK